ncbi:unnamed protein product [Thelazia callipaeda]|uniref:BLOC-1-related complex subunit 5 n=1 Tax=Thelazia callipaeda TaxID=103827 RepID=A0A158RBA3_THECL|nr:unnamed protein product [Thelazia callipaeda]
MVVAVSEKKCLVCRRSPFTYENVGDSMSEKTKKYFQTPYALIVNALRKVESVIKFQQNQYSIMRKNVNSMRNEIVSIADRCRETEKICEVLRTLVLGLFQKINASSLMVGIQQQCELLQHLNPHPIHGAQMENMANISTVSSMSVIAPIFDEGNCTEQLFQRTKGVKGAHERQSETLSNLDPARTKPSGLKCATRFNNDHSLQHSEAVLSGSLETIFANANDNNKKIKPPICNNPYLDHISRKRSQTLIAAQNGGDDFITQQHLDNKRSLKVPKEIQFSRSLSRIEPNSHNSSTLSDNPRIQFLRNNHRF